MKPATKRKLASATTAGVASLMLAQSMHAVPVSINSASFSYTQNFDSLAANTSTATASSPWTNSSTIAGWVAFQSLPATATGASHTAGRDPFTGTGTSPNQYQAVTSYLMGSGTATNGALYSFGTVGASERALGSVGSGTPGDFFWGIEFTNDTGLPIDSITVSYRGEQWRNGGNTATNVLEFDYSRTATSYSDNAAFTAVGALNFTSPIVGASAASLDGNAAGNFTNTGPVTITSIGLLPGETLRLRWFDDDHAGSDHALSIDDFSFQAEVVPEPGTLGVLGIGALGLLLRRKKE